MSYRMMSAADFHKAVRCFATLPDPTDPYKSRERVYYRIVTRETKMFPGSDCKQHVMVKIAPEDKPHDIGWYRMDALFFEMPNGEVMK